MNAIDEILNRSHLEEAAALLAEAPEFAIALRDIAMRDVAWTAGIWNNYKLGPDQPDLVILHEGDVARIRVAALDFRVTTPEAGDQTFGSYNFTTANGRRQQNTMFRLLTGDEHLERLYELGGWTMPDGTQVRIDRERGIYIETA